MTDVIIVVAAVVTVIGGIYKAVPVVRKSRLVLLAGIRVRIATTIGMQFGVFLSK